MRASSETPPARREPSRAASSRRRLGSALLALAVFGLALGVIARGIHVGRGGGDAPAFFVDEAHKIAEAYYFGLFFVHRDFAHPSWTRDFYARTNPPVAKYVFGAVLAAGGHPVRVLDLQQDFERLSSVAPGRLRGLVPDATLRLTRHTSAVFAAATCALLFVTGARVGGLATGALAAVLLLGNPTFLRLSRLGMTDTILLFSLALVVPVCLRCVAALRRHRALETARAADPLRLLATAALAGLVIALAAGTKLVGGLAAPIFAASLVACEGNGTSGRPARERLARVGGMIGVAAVVAFVTFVAINPYYHAAPVARALATLDVVRDWVLNRQLEPGEGLFHLSQRATAVAYFCLRSPDLPLARAFGALGIGAVGLWLTSLGFVWGVVRLSVQGLGRGASRDPARVALVWALVLLAGVALWLPLAWYRYFLLPLLAASLVTAIGLASLPGALRDSIGGSGAHARARRRGTVAGGLAAAALVATVLTFTSIGIDPTRAPWSFVYHLGEPDLVEKYVDAVQRNPESPRARWQLAQALVEQREPESAVAQLESALEWMPRDDADPAVSAQRYRMLEVLAAAKSLASDPGGARALEEQIEIAAALRDAMRSGDPKVRAEFDRIVASRRRLLAALADR